ncbi:hypothetical protein CEB3_c00230 [Peptococcaceae bacterium CEB3]|nr:hypothetical protein CEB3_c00230 [Peptococcaceae bacterium CEB3]
MRVDGRVGKTFGTSPEKDSVGFCSRGKGDNMLIDTDGTRENNIATAQTVIAASVSWELAKLAGSSHPYLAPVAVILSLHVTLGKSILHGFRRIVGTFLGAFITMFIAPYLGMFAWTIGLVVLLGMGIARLMALSSEVGHQAAVSALLILAIQAGSKGYSLDRIRDTIIGVCVAILANWVVDIFGLRNNAR